MLSVYPACFFKESNGYSVIFPDLNYLSTCGDTLDEALKMAVDCLAGYLYTCKREGEEVPAPSPVSAPTPSVPTITARVIVGNYPTTEQAEVAKGILQEAGLGVTPFIRKMGNGYTLQVASYGSKEKAMSVAESLLNQNFPAKVIVEYRN